MRIWTAADWTLTGVLVSLMIASEQPTRWIAGVVFVLWVVVRQFWRDHPIPVPAVAIGSPRTDHLPVTTREESERTLHVLRQPKSTPHDAILESLRDLKLDCEIWLHDECSTCGAMNWIGLSGYDGHMMPTAFTCWCCNNESDLVRASVKAMRMAQTRPTPGDVHPIRLRAPEAALGGTNTGIHLNVMRTAGRYCVDYVGELLQREARRDSKTPCGYWDANLERPFRFAQKVNEAAQEVPREN